MVTVPEFNNELAQEPVEEEMMEDWWDDMLMPIIPEEEGMPDPTVSVGADADITVINPDREWVFDAAASASKASNSPFDGWTLKGRAVATIVAGNPVWIEQAETIAV